MKLAFLNHTFRYGEGPDRVISEVAKRLKNKYEITIISSQNDINIDGTKKQYLHCPKIFGFPTPILTPQILKTLDNFDATNVHFLPFAYFSLFSRKPTIFTFHGWTNIPENERKSKFLLTMREMILKASGKLTSSCIIVAVSQYLKRIAENWNSNVCIIPNGVDITLYNPGSDKGYMLYVGRLVRYKGVHELIKAASAVGIDLHIAGSGPEFNVLMKLVKKLNINDRVKFLGRIPESQLVDEYRSCSFFVSASKWEGFGIPFLEANSCGKAVVGYNKAAIPERIMNGRNGFLVNNYQELESSIRILSNDAVTRGRFGSEGRKIAKTYDWAVVVDMYDKLFQQVSLRFT